MSTHGIIILHIIATMVPAYRYLILKQTLMVNICSKSSGGKDPTLPYSTSRQWIKIVWQYILVHIPRD